MRRLSRFRCAGVLLVGLTTVAAQGAKHDKPVAPPPTVRILTEPLGYHPLSSFYLMGRTSSVSLDFIDKEHLLFTFRVPGLLKRLSDCKADDEDQIIRAMVVHLPDGAVERSADWRMHDRGRYLWALRDGKFLVRERDAIWETDSGLELQPYLQSAMPIRLVKLSPDARLLLVESDLEKHTEEEHKQLVANAELEGLSPPREDVQMSILRTDTRAMVGRVRALNPTDLPLIENGFLEALSAKGDHWMVRYRPFEGEPSVIADIASSCHPNESPLNDKTLMVSVCPNNGDHVVQAISLSGKPLWSYKWDSHYIWPTTASAENGQRVAFSTLRVSRPLSAIDPFDESELQGQRIEVLDVDTGHLELTQFATPMLSGGQNYALSPDGGRFAVLRENAIEIYELPAPSGAPGNGTAE
jgi:hypothetical protein